MYDSEDTEYGIQGMYAGMMVVRNEEGMQEVVYVMCLCEGDAKQR